MNGLSLFSGAGIGELALKHIIPNYRTIGYVEWETYCQEVIRARIRDGILDDAPIFGDIREFNERFATLYAGKVDFISGGFPCQPFSTAGHRRGEADERNMWPATRDAISIIRPRFALLENVPGLLVHNYIKRIFGELAEVGYDCEWDVVSAAFVGAQHLRNRIWIVAYPSNTGSRKVGTYATNGIGRQQSDDVGSGCQIEPTTTMVADSEGQRCRETRQYCERSEKRAAGSGTLSDTTSQGFVERYFPKERPTPRYNRQQYQNWSIEPDVGRVAHGVASRVDRLKALGNGWVPQVVRRVLEISE